LGSSGGFAGLRQFAPYQPFTAVIQTIRGLLTGGPIDAHAIAAVAWSAGIALACYLWLIRLYDRHRASDPKLRISRRATL
jgi:ABC-2 type transport system permease protein